MRLNIRTESLSRCPGRRSLKYQVTIPKEIREKVDVKPGEMISMEVVSQDEIVLRRFLRGCALLRLLSVYEGPLGFGRHRGIWVSPDTSCSTCRCALPLHPS